MAELGSKRKPKTDDIVYIRMMSCDVIVDIVMTSIPVISQTFVYPTSLNMTAILL